MYTRLLSALAIALIATGCSGDTQEESPGEVLARDSSLASELRQADTSAFAEAADVAMAFDPDSAMPPVETTSPAAASPPASTVPMRVERPDSAAPAPAARPPMRPVPATIHPDPIPTRRLPAAPPTRSASVSRPATAASRPATSATRPAASGAVPSPSPVPSREAVSILSAVPGASLPPAGSDVPCSSPTAPNQRRCLMLHLARSDVGLDRSYQALIADMKREAGTAPGAREPESVQQLRVAQRAWLVYRDTECRRRNRGKEGPLWAPVRAQCLAEFSGARTEELTQALRDRRGR